MELIKLCLLWTYRESNVGFLTPAKRIAIRLQVPHKSLKIIEFIKIYGKK